MLSMSAKVCFIGFYGMYTTNSLPVWSAVEKDCVCTVQSTSHICAEFKLNFIVTAWTGYLQAIFNKASPNHNDLMNYYEYTKDGNEFN